MSVNRSRLEFPDFSPDFEYWVNLENQEDLGHWKNLENRRNQTGGKKLNSKTIPANKRSQRLNLSIPEGVLAVPHRVPNGIPKVIPNVTPKMALKGGNLANFVGGFADFAQKFQRRLTVCAT